MDGETYRERCAIRLKQLRLDCGKSIDEVAEEIGQKPRNLYNWEASKSEPKHDDLPKLANCFGLKSPREVLAEN